MKKIKILLIDDEIGFTEVLADAFLPYEEQISFFTANLADLGIEIALKEEPNIIIVDLRIPRLNGEQIVKQLKEKLPTTKFVVVSGWDEGKTPEQMAKQIGVEAFFYKPVSLRVLMPTILDSLNISLKKRDL